MGFWHWVDKIVGYVPVVGTIKDGVEAVVLECEGKHKAALEKALETAVDLAGDIVTVASLGEACEVAVAGKAAAEAALKDAMEAGLKSAAKEQMVQATREGYTKEAATMMAIAGAAQEAKLAAKEGIARRAGKEGPKPGNKPDNKPHGHKKDPKRGHHVINNGVRRIHPKIIDAFLEHNANYFDGQSFEILVEHGFIEPEMNIYQSHERPFNEEDDEFIQTTVAFTPGGEIHRDINDVEYGTLTGALRVGVSHYMTSLFHMRVRQTPMPRPEQEVAVAITFVAYEMNSNEVYVDRQALEWWIATGGNEARFLEVRDVVANSFRDLTGGANLVLAWVHDLVDIYERIHNTHQ